MANPEEIEARTTSAGELCHPANQSWIARNERFVRTVCMLAIYVFGALCLISILALGAFVLITGILLGLVLAAALGIVVLQIRNRWG